MRSLLQFRDRTGDDRDPQHDRVSPPSREWTEDADGDTDTNANATADADAEPIADATPFRLGRILFGGVLALNAVDNLRNLDERIAYAEAKGAPRPSITVPAVSGGLLAGGLGVALWRLPAAGAAAIVGFLASITPVMHDFWNHEDDEQKQQELIHFLKNTALLGAALAFLNQGWRRRGSADGR